MNLNRLTACLALVVGLCLGSLQSAGAWQTGGYSTSQQIRFTPPVEGTCRLVSGTVSQGRIVSISEVEIVMLNAQNNELNLETSRVRTVRTRDGAFQYSPGEDDFSDAIRRAGELDGVTIGEVYNAPQPQEQPNQPPAGVGQNPAPNRPPVGANNPPVGTQPMGTQSGDGTGNSPSYSSSQGFANPAPNIPFGQDPSTLPRCSECGNVLSADALEGQSCPHCGVLFTASPLNYPSVSNPTGGHAGYTSNPPADAHGGAATANQPAGGFQPAPPASTVGPSGFSFDAMPMWAKAGAFIGFLFVLYMVVSSRR